MKRISRQIVPFVEVVVAILSVSAPSWGAEPNIVGSWKLLSVVAEDETGKTSSPFGEHPKGYLIYTSEGRMMGLFVHEKRSPPRIDEDRINLHKYMVAYSGRYTVEGEKVVHHVDISWDERLTGTDQIRFIKLEGDKLTIKTPPIQNPFTGLGSITGVLVWEREK
jgi:hypothetical protein